MSIRCGIIVSQTFPEARGVRGGVLAAARQALKARVRGEPVRLLHLPDLLDGSEYREIGRLLNQFGARAVLCVTRALNEAGLNLSSLDAVNRRAAVALAQRHLLCAVEAGASFMDVIGGARPEAGRREEALEALLDSMCELSRFARERTPTVSVQVEPLDHSFHKRNTLGTAGEAVWLCEAARRCGESVGLCLDSAHMGLNGEDVPAGVRLAAPHLTEFHLCNCCAEPGHPMSGDLHIAPGAPGLFDRADYARMVRELSALNRDVMLFAEVLKPESVSGEAQLKACIAILEAALEGSQI